MRYYYRLSFGMTFLLLFNMMMFGQEHSFSSKFESLKRLSIKNPQLALDSILILEDAVMKTNDPLIIANYEFQKGSCYRALGDIVSSLRHFNNADSVLGSRNEPRLKSSIIYGIANLYIIQKKYGEAQELLQEIKPMIDQLQDTTKLIDWYCHLARSFINQDKTSEGLEYALAANELNEKYKGEGSQAFVYMVLGDAYHDLKSYDKSIGFYQKAINHYERVENSMMLIPSYINISTSYSAKGDIVQAMQYLDKVKAIKDLAPTDVGYYTAMLNRAVYLVDMGRFEEAKVQTQENLDYAFANDRDPAHALYWMGVIHRGLDRYDIAEEYIEKAFLYTRDKKNYGPASFYAHALHQTYLWKDKFEPALQWYQTHVQYRDSIWSDRKMKDTELLMSKIEKLEQQKEIAELENKAIKSKQKRNLLWILLCSSMLIGGLVIYHLVRRRKQDRLLQEAKITALTIEKEFIQKELDLNEKQLTSQVLHLAQKNTFMVSLKESIASLIDEGEDKVATQARKIVRQINQSMGDDDQWDEFMASFTKVHQSFLRHIQSMSSDLTSNDIRLASLLRMNLSSKDIASMLNISAEGVKKARYRLRKKLGLDSEVNIQDYLLGYQ